MWVKQLLMSLHVFGISLLPPLILQSSWGQEPCLFIFFFFWYLFIWLHRVLVVVRKTFSLYRGMRIFSCSVWDLVPQPGIEPGAPALGAWSLSYWTTREVPPTLYCSNPTSEIPLTHGSLKSNNFIDPIIPLIVTSLEILLSFQWSWQQTGGTLSDSVR